MGVGKEEREERDQWLESEHPSQAPGRGSVVTSHSYRFHFNFPNKRQERVDLEETSFNTKNVCHLKQLCHQNTMFFSRCIYR